MFKIYWIKYINQNREREPFYYQLSRNWSPEGVEFLNSCIYSVCFRAMGESIQDYC